MPAFDVLLAFAVTTALFAFIPGPAMFYAAARTLAGGRKAGLMAVLGIHLGSYVHIIAAAAGLSFLFHAVPVAYTLVKLAGALYLIWLGFSMIRSKTENPQGTEQDAAKSARSAFIQSVTVEVLNPKTAIFFVAFLPQFIDSTASFPVWLQFAIFGIAINAIFTFADVVSVLIASMIMKRMKQSGTLQKVTQRLGGTILVGLGAHLALQKS